MENNNKKNEKELTLTDVIEAIKGVENRLDKKIDGVESSLSKKIGNLDEKINTSIDGLAIMIQKSLLNTEENIKKEIISLRDNLESDRVKNKAESNKKVCIFDHNDLKFRVEKLEEKVGITQKK